MRLLKNRKIARGEVVFYSNLPKEYKSSLPSVEEKEAKLGNEDLKAVDND